MQKTTGEQVREEQAEKLELKRKMDEHSRIQHQKWEDTPLLFKPFVIIKEIIKIIFYFFIVFLHVIFCESVGDKKEI